MKKLHIVLLALGFGFLVFLIWHIGARQLWQQLMALGWGIVPILLLEGLAELCHAISWRYCFSGPYRRMPLGRLFKIHIAGYALNFLTPTVSVAGDVTKAGLLAENRRGPEAVASVLIGKLSFGLGMILFVTAGLIFILPVLHLPLALRLVLFLISGALAAGMGVFLLLQKRGALGAFVHLLAEQRIFPKTLRRILPPLQQVDDVLKKYHREQPADLVWSVFWHVLGYATGIFGTWYFLYLVTDHPGLGAAARIWILTMWIDLVTFAVPLNMGVLEGGRLLAFRTFGFGALPGITFGVVTRLAQLFWAGIGLLTYTLLITSRQPRTDRQRLNWCGDQIR